MSERTVGAITLGLVAMATVFAIAISPHIAWRTPARITVTFRATGGLHDGAAFVVAGKPVGRVEAISLAGDRVRVHVAFHGRLPRGDVFVTSRGIVSERYLELGAAPPDAPLLRDGDVIAGIDPPTLDQALQRSWANLVIASEFAAAIEPEVFVLRAELATLAASLARLPPFGLALGHAPDLAPLRGMARDAAHTLARVRSTIARLRASAAALPNLPDRALAPHLETALERTRAMLVQAEALLAQVDAVQAILASQEGSLMRLLHDPELPEDAKDIGKVIKRSPWKLFARPVD